MNLLLEAGSSGGGLSSLFGGGNTIIFTIVYFVIIIGLMYFIMFRPQRKQQKEHKALIDSVEVGDSVLTSSGFYGVVIDVTDDTVIVEFGNNKNCRIPMQREAIVELEKKEK